MGTAVGKTVFVGLSGGVDSSVAALRLLREGYTVVGVFIKVWQPDFLVCNWEQERLDAMRVAAHLKIPFLTFDAAEVYKEEVGQYFINEYIAGRTPNPDVMCNKFVKFGAFLSFAKAKGADYVATGHYAMSRKSKDGYYELSRGVDVHKDQSYFLWTLTQEQLAHILLPVGSSTKDVIRKEAGAAGIPTAQKKDSQGVCFLGHIDIPDFISHFTTLKAGDVLNEHGEVIGAHKGALVYTLGQRHGFMVTKEDDESHVHYVISKDLNRNTITVATKPPHVASGDTITLSETNWMHDVLKEGDSYHAQFRYRQEPIPVTISNVGSGTCVLKLGVSTEAPALGQSCVLYQGTTCLGGGIIS